MPDSGTAAPPGDDPTESGPTTVTTGNVLGAAGAVPGLRPGEGGTGEGLPRVRGGHRGGRPPGRRYARPAGPARDRARDAREVEPGGDLRGVAEADRGRAPVELLRGAAHGERHAWRAPHRGQGLQGPLPPVQDHAGVPRHPQGRDGTATGCPWEVAVEKELGLSGKKDIGSSIPASRAAHSRTRR